MNGALNVCPCCKQVVDASRMLVRVNLDYNSVTFAGKTVDLTGQQAELMHMLAVNMPRVVPMDRLIDGLWGIDNPKGNTHKHVMVVVCQVRRAIAELGLRIRNDYGVGYALEMAQSDELAA